MISARRFPPAKRHLPARWRTAGFTLTEVLVALAITSLMVTVLIGALYYVFRVQETLRNEVVTRESELRARAWFAQALAGCLAAPRTGNSAFSGSAREIRCETLTPIQPRAIPVPARILIELLQGGEGDTRLAYTEIDGGGREPRVINVWPATEIAAASFHFIDARGVEFDRWPGDHPDEEALPRQVKIILKQSAGGGEAVWPVALQATPWLEPPPRSNPFGIDTLR